VAASATTRERVVSALGLELFVRERGNAGRPLLLVNGAGGNIEMWGQLEERLSQSARTIAFDSPGTGRSSTPLYPLPIKGLARILARTLDDLGHPQVDVLGFSLGGLVAQQFARDRPERVRRLILAATACGWGSLPGSMQALTALAMPIRYHSRRLYEESNRLLGPVDAATLRRLTALTEARVRHPPSLLGYAYQLWAGAAWSSLPWLSGVRVPTLVLHGDGDRLVPPANAVQLARLLPESRLHVLRDEGHFFVFDPRSRCVPLLEEFITSADLRESQAWTGGAAVDDDALVEEAFAASPGAQPYRALSDGFRRLFSEPNDNGAGKSRSPARDDGLGAGSRRP
jgi:pimeloyl-ACP methyl ester carboxylesterase